MRQSPYLLQKSHDVSFSRMARRKGGNGNRVSFLVKEIGQRIVGGEYVPGGTLPVEQELSDAYKAGRNAVREAIKVLSGKGLIRTERRVGTVVLPRSNWAMLDPDVVSWMLDHTELRQKLLLNLSQLRRVIEPESAALAAEFATTTEILRLFEAFEKMGEHRQDRELAILYDIAFHDRLMEASHNMLLASMSRSIGTLLRANFEISIRRADGYIRNLEQHGKVADAILRRDPEGARKEMLHLLSNNDEDLQQMMQAPTTRTSKGGRERRRL